jgi:hypothetical protein
LLLKVKQWVLTSGEAYARKELDKTGVPAEGIEAIIRKANSLRT